MKRALVLAFSVVLVFTLTSVSIAATVTAGGELNFGKSWCDGYSTVNRLSHRPPDLGNVSDAKVSFSAIIAEDIQAFVAFKGELGNDMNADEAWVQFTEEYGTVKVGYFGYAQDQKDIIDDVVPDVKSGLTVSYTTKLSDQVTLNLAAANNGLAKDSLMWWLLNLSGCGLDYSAGLAYDSENFGINGNYFKYAASDSANAFSVMSYIKLDALKFYAQYNHNSYWLPSLRIFPPNYDWRLFPPGVQNFIIGIVYDSAVVPFFARVEYDLNDQYTGDNEWALRLAYKMTGNVKFQYTLRHYNRYYFENSYWGTYTMNELLLIATF